MNSPTRTPAARRAGARRQARVEDEAHGLAAAPMRLKIALGLAVVAAIAAAIALPLGVLRGAPRPGFGSGPVLLVLALLPVVLAVGLVTGNRQVMGARVLVGAALIAPGALLNDVQLLLDSTRVARPELTMPTNLATLSPDLGGWLLVASHVVAIAAGLAAAGLAGATPGTEYAEGVDNPDHPRSLPAARRMLGLSLVCGVVVAIGTLMPALYSHNALLVAVDVVPNPWLVRVGGLLIAVVAPIALAWSAGTGNPDVHRGVALGVFSAVAAVSVPPLAAGMLMDQVGVAPGPIVALIGAALAVGIAGSPVRDEDADTTGEGTDVLAGDVDPRSAAAVQVVTSRHDPEVTLGGKRLHQAAGLLGVLLGIGAVVSALTTVYTVRPIADSAAAAVVGEPTKLGIAAGVLVAVLGLLVTLAGAAFRPAFAVALGGLALPAALALDDALSATRARDSIQASSVPGAGEEVAFGPAFWLSVLLLAGAAVAAVLAALAGVAEREELDPADGPDNQILWAPVGLAALAAVGAFGLPLVTAPHYPVPGLFTNFTLVATGQLLALLAVVAAAVLAPSARPARGAGLLLGAAGVVGVRLLQFPFTSARMPGATPAIGWWLALLALGLLLAGAVVAATARLDTQKP